MSKADGVARYYDATKNRAGGFYAGVPLADITADEWSALTERQQANVDGCGWYAKTKPAEGAAPEQEQAQAEPQAGQEEGQGDG